MAFLNYNKNNAAAAQTDTTDIARIIPVNIEEIDFSPLNPRHSRGEHYENTKASIRNVGLQNMLVITKRPGDERYTLYYGGNTRLAILKELVDEYRAAGKHEEAVRLQMQQCRYTPYTSDLDILIKHMSENEDRSGMTLIDKARAVHRIREMYQELHGVDSVSNNQLVKYIHSTGWTRVNQPAMTELNFAYEHLQSVIPLALTAGLGKRKVNQLRLWLKHVEIYLDWLVDKGTLTREEIVNGETVTIHFTTADARKLYFEVLAEFDSDLEEDGDPLLPHDSSSDDVTEVENNRLFDMDEFFTRFRYRLSDALLPFDENLTSVRIEYELEQVRELGYVPETVPQAALREQIQATADVPPAVFPTPRKPRSPSEKHHEKSHASQDADDIDTRDHQSPAVTAHDPATTETGCVDTLSAPGSRTASPSGTGQTDGRSGGHGPANTVYTPYGAPLRLPDSRLSYKAYNAATRELCDKMLDMLFVRYDSRGLLRRLINNRPQEDQDTLNAIVASTPYFYFLIPDDATYHEIQDLLEHGVETERYALLYIMQTWYFYLRRVFNINDDTLETNASLTDQERFTYRCLRELWPNYAAQYGDYQFWCNSGLFYLQDETAAQEWFLVNHTICTHTGYLYGAETHVETIAGAEGV